MTPDRWRQVTGLFHGALAHDAARREAYLDDVCTGDSALRAEVDAMLAAHRDAGRFGDAPLVVLPDDAEPALTSVGTVTSDASPGERIDPTAGNPDRRRHPFVWLVCVAALVTAAAFAYAASLLIVDGGASPAFGWNEARRSRVWFVTRIESGGPAAGWVKEGDRLLSLDGSPPFGRAGTTFHRRTLSVGDTYRLAVDRQGERLELTLPVSEGPNLLSTYLTYTFVSLVWCLVGLFIGLARPEQPVARLASAAAVMTGLNFLNAFIQVGPLFHPMHVVVGYHFFCRFPTGHSVTGIWRWILVAMYGAGAVPFVLGVWLHGTLLSQGVPGAAQLVTAHQALFELRGPPLTYLFYASLILMVTMVARNYRRLTEEDQRRRVRWIVYGSIIALTPQMSWAAAEVIMGVAAASRFGLAANAFTAGIPLAVAYAVVKHRVFDIKVVVRRGVQYLLARRALQCAIAMPIAALAYTVAVNRDRTIAALITESTGYLYWLVIAGLSLRLRRPIHLWLDRRFFRDEYDREQMLLALADDLGKVDSISQLSELVRAKLELAMHPTSVYLWYRDPGERAVAASSDPFLTPPDFPSSGRWLSWLEDHAAVAEVPLPADAGLSRHDSDWLASRGVSLLVPITDSSDRLAGVLLLGAKKSEQPYTASDRRLMRTIARQAAVVRENLRLRAQVGEEQRMRHDVLARLDHHRVNLLKECPSCGACFDGPAQRCDRDGRTLTLSLPISRTVEGKYRLDRLMGKGGMGAVYEAADLRLGRVVAVKVLLGRAFGNQAALRRFGREARAAARLNHPRIVSVYDYGALEGEGAYIVMEHVQGRTLRAELERVKVMTPAEVAEWMDQILDGLAAAHGQGVVHRDLKPENIIGRRSDGRLDVKILDFGLAKVDAETLGTGTMTAEGVVMGTFGYMSPEQRCGAAVDQRTDIFAIGIMLAEALTGTRPLQADTLRDLTRAVLNDSYHLPCASPAARAVDDVLQHCLARRAADRPATASALRAALMPILRACPPTAFAS